MGRKLPKGVSAGGSVHECWCVQLVAQVAATGVTAMAESPFGWPPFAPLLVVLVRVADLWPTCGRSGGRLLGEPLWSGIPNRLASFNVLVAGAWCWWPSTLMMVCSDGVVGNVTMLVGRV